MLIGIDVGGTYTDAVLLVGQSVKKTVKIPTNKEKLLEVIAQALDRLLAGIDPQQIERVVLSTTLITNLIAEGKYEPIGIIAIPGPGLTTSYISFPAETAIVTGAIDYRGREIIPLDEEEVEQALRKFQQKGLQKIVVVGKFSPRNNSHELKVNSIANRLGFKGVELGHRAAGQLNFLRRIASTYLTAATREAFTDFAAVVDRSIRERRIAGDIYILKADGGTMPLNLAVNRPVETIFSGPAASTLGVKALTPPDVTSVVLDIGGTTTDLALILNGKPLLASKGAKVKGHLTQVRSLAVRSVAVGGDSRIRIEDGKVQVGPERSGQAFALGGPEPTPTDALRVLGLIEFGDLDLARQGMELVSVQLGTSIEDAAQLVIDAAVNKIVAEINAMFREWEQEPAYRIWELLQKTKIRPQLVVGVGGGAAGLVPLVARKLGCNSLVPEFAESANAIGAAVSRPTVTATLRIDTQQGLLTLLEEGHQERFQSGSSFGIKDATGLAMKWLKKRADTAGIQFDVQDVEVLEQEVFNVVRGGVTSGKIFDVKVQLPPGILHLVTGGDQDGN